MLKKLIKFAIYSLVAVSILVLLIFLIFHFSHKPIISYFKYYKANNICYESDFQECKKALKQVISFYPTGNDALKAQFRIKHYLSKQDNLPKGIIDATNAANDDINNKNYLKALKELEKIKSEYPEFELSYFYIAEIKYFNSEYDSSIKILNQGLKVNKDYYDFYHYLGKNYFELGRIALDKKDYQKATMLFKTALENFKKVDNEINTYDCLPDHLTDTKDYIDFIDRKSRKNKQ